MKYLLEIIRIATKKKVRKLEILDNQALNQKSNKFAEFYDAIASGKIQTDADAAREIYNSAPHDDKYRQLKSRFKRRLLNTLFFLDMNRPATGDYHRAYYSALREWTLLGILRSNQAHSTATHVAQGILHTALK